jgi:endonuclease G, mitochondrial
MGILATEQIAKAQQRLDFDIRRAIAELDGRTPAELNTEEQLASRRDFLMKSLGDPGTALTLFERIIAGNELQPVNYLERGAVASQAVARIEIRRPDGRRLGFGTGFLIAPSVLLTNNHVLPTRESAASSVAQFDYQADLHDRLLPLAEFGLEPGKLFWTSRELDFTVVAVRERTGDRPLSDFGFLPLLGDSGKSAEGEWLTIVQHPAGQPKQLCVRENRLIKRAADVLWYTSDTLGGSSGSPVFNNDWFVVALHHSGVPAMVGDKIQGVDGRLYAPHEPIAEENVKWVANEGIRASRIVQTLREQQPTHPLLQPLLAARPESARIGHGPTRNSPVARTGPSPVSIPASPTMSNPSESQSLSSGQTITVPIQLSITIASDQAVGAANVISASESTVAVDEASRSRRPRQPSFDVPFVSDYKDRQGYNPKFLGEGEKLVGLPQLSPALEAEAAPLIKGGGFELKYHNFSVAMHKRRRLAIYSAANINFAERYEMGRPRDSWRIDHRIEIQHQVGESLYASNQFDRGHLTRREDLEFGPTAMAALQSAADTCHFTNCVPQHARFNQSKEIWQGIERHLLESAIVANQFKAQLFTGPVFREDDPEYRGIQYPISYWKVVAAINASGKLFATAYLASQADVIDQYGIEAAPEVPFGPFKSFQVRIAEIERLTGLSFVSGKNNASLSMVDPLATSSTRRRSSGRRLRVRRDESFESVEGRSDYLELSSLDDIVLD